MTTHLLKKLGVTAALAVTAGAAEAATFDASYQFGSGHVVAFQVEGTLLGDGNTIIVTDTIAASINGTPFPYTDFVTQAEGIIPTLTLDGFYLDYQFFSLADHTRTFGLVSDYDWAFIQEPPLVLYEAISLIPGGYSATYATVPPTASVPLPAAGLLLLTALAGTAALSRRKVAAPLAA